MRQIVLLLFLAVLPAMGCTSSNDPDGQESTRPAASASSSAAGEPAADTCDPVPPRQLPSGAAPGEARPFASDYGDALAWGKGADRLVQLPGANPLELGKDWPKEVPLRGSHARVTAIGDPGQVAFVFALNECVYTNWLGPGISMDDAETYISAF